MFHVSGVSVEGLAQEWVAFLHTAAMATVVMCRVRNPAALPQASSMSAISMVD